MEKWSWSSEHGGGDLRSKGRDLRMETTFWPPEQWGINLCCLNHPVYGFLLWESNTLFEQEHPSMWWMDSVQFIHSVVSNSLRPHELQHARPPCPSPTPRVHPNPCSLRRWYYPTSHLTTSLSPPALNPSRHQGLFKWVSSSHNLAKVLEFQLQHQSYQWTPRTDLS